VRLVLASASPARLGVLRSAGLDPLVEVSDIDEDALLAAHADEAPEKKVTLLASAKATAVARRVGDAHPDALVVGCDSMLFLDGELTGKPGDADTARRRWAAMAGRTGELVTGHTVLRLADGEIDRVAEGHAVTGVRFAEPTPDELDAYLATGEPLQVAGAFTIDGLGGAFVSGIEGDHHTVVGVSLPLLRDLMTELGHRWTELWTAPS
jgi:septum formation protein